MPQPPERAAELADTVARLTAALLAAGYEAGATRPIDYGRQFGVGDGTARLLVNIYGGKKGVRIVVVGAGTPLHTAVGAIAQQILGGGSGSALEKAGGAATRENFGPGPWIGSDESGKGDYFGPLAAAAVFVAPEQEATLRTAGVRDSKLLDDAAAHRVAAEIRRLCAGSFAEDLLPPAQYNACYARLKADGQNLNHLLAERHVLVLDAILARGGVAGPSGLSVIADQFADERLVRERLCAALKGRGAPLPRLLQTPRAEANVAVAAASILARDRFLTWLDDASARLGVRLPKGGANPAIVDAGRRIVQQGGRAALGDVAKLHFATTARVLA
ncbi:MAG TPA: ribonuclease HIII [Dehalococcoidia bacterium]|nr:ribonuclease HIII [Dehalococcoidia bacterium]